MSDDTAGRDNAPGRGTGDDRRSDVHEWTSSGTFSYPCPLCDGKGYLTTHSDERSAPE